MSVKEKRGFTLIELIVVIAVLAILAAIAIPQYVGLKDSSKASVCQANRDTVLRLYLAYTAAGQTADLNTIIQQDGLTAKDLCPSGGTYSLEQDADGNVTGIKCSKHGASEKSGIYYDPTQAFIKALSGVTIKNGKRIDSASPTGVNTTAVKTALKNAGVDLDKIGIKGWAILNSSQGKQIIWTDQDIAGMKSGTACPAICYDINTKLYMVITTSATVYSSTNNYNVLAKDDATDGVGTISENPKDYLSLDAAITEYQSRLSKLGLK